MHLIENGYFSHVHLRSVMGMGLHFPNDTGQYFALSKEHATHITF
jgi:hypothetical protein